MHLSYLRLSSLVLLGTMAVTTMASQAAVSTQISREKSQQQSQQSLIISDCSCTENSCSCRSRPSRNG
ncbi:MAG: hypothetical protein KME64_35400 [Scytonematopsis contorta HA4267-MV1]|nr:hypothetical protein [Scytonematopsis contorta HA4267-MV1]